MASIHETSLPPSNHVGELAPLFADPRIEARRPVDQEPPRATLRRLLWVFCGLASLYVLLYLLRPLVYELQYASSYAQEKARVEAALEGLEQLDVDELSTAFRLVAQRTSPSVVQVRTKRTDRREVSRDERPFPFGIPPRLETEGQGSGVIVDEEGYIVTNRHVIAGAEEVSVQLSDGRELPAVLVGADVLTDLAVLKVNDDQLIALSWGDSEVLQPGDMVWAVGSPFGLERSVTFGIVSAKGRHGRWSSHFQNFLQTDAAVNPGNSGGPLVNVRGELIGVNTAIVGQSYQGISFAIPSAIAKDVYEDIRKLGKKSRGWLGVSMTELPPGAAESLGMAESRGAWVQPGQRGVPAVIPGSPADRGGIRRGDVIVGWNSEPVADPKRLSELVADTEIASRAEVEVIREGQPLTIEVTVAERTFEDRFSRDD